MPDPQDPNPSEPSNPDLPGQKKRDWSPPDSGEVGTTTNLLYAAKPHPKTRPIQQDTDAYLEGIGLHSFRNLRGPEDPEKPPVRKPTKKKPPEQEQQPPMIEP